MSMETTIALSGVDKPASFDCLPTPWTDEKSITTEPTQATAKAPKARVQAMSRRESDFEEFGRRIFIRFDGITRLGTGSFTFPGSDLSAGPRFSD